MAWGSDNPFPILDERQGLGRPGVASVAAPPPNSHEASLAESNLKANEEEDDATRPAA